MSWESLSYELSEEMSQKDKAEILTRAGVRMESEKGPRQYDFDDRIQPEIHEISGKHYDHSGSGVDFRIRAEPSNKNSSPDEIEYHIQTASRYNHESIDIIWKKHLEEAEEFWENTLK